MKRKVTLYVVMILAGSFVSQAVVTFSAPQAKKSLYHRLGGYDAIAAVSDEFIGRLATDKELSRFFVGLNNESKKRVRQHVIDLLCATTGGPCLYLGQDMKTAHRGLGITEQDWDRAVKDLVETLDKFKVGRQEKEELLGALSGLKNDIVGK
ncbi:MAG TPA: group 1 truncated hemoglobin [Blastocatellia bacterium]|nr:group 1 truncated hemoglobin [Blastocatellia bacterium]